MYKWGEGSHLYTVGLFELFELSAEIFRTWFCHMLSSCISPFLKVDLYSLLELLSQNLNISQPWLKHSKCPSPSLNQSGLPPGHWNFSDQPGLNAALFVHRLRLKQAWAVNFRHGFVTWSWKLGPQLGFTSPFRSIYIGYLNRHEHCKDRSTRHISLLHYFWHFTLFLHVSWCSC